MKFLLVLLAFVSFTRAPIVESYTPDWSSLDKRPLPSWYDNAKIGIFIHWGVFSVPAYHSEWFWQDWQGPTPIPDVVEFMKKSYPPDFTYPDFAAQFKAEFFDPDHWASLIKASGAKYVVLTSKHHEGYCLWPSAYSWNWNSIDVGPHRDLIGDLANSIRAKTDVRFGLYHSQLEWFNPLYLSDKASGFKNQDFVKAKALPELIDLVVRYKPEVLWADGEWEASSEYWNETSFLAWLYNESPVRETVVVNDRWSTNTSCKHGDFFTCSDNYNPRKLLGHKWENCMPLDKKSWGYRRNLELTDILTFPEIIESLVETVSCGGNILINIGPTKEGTIAPIFEERLTQLGDWLVTNGEAIYESHPWKFQNDTVNPNVWYTSSNSSAVYAILLKWPADRKVVVKAPVLTESTRISLLGFSGQLQWVAPPDGGILIDLSSVRFDRVDDGGAGWVFKLTNLAN